MQKISSKIVITNNVDFVDKSHQIKVQINCTDQNLEGQKGIYNLLSFGDDFFMQGCIHWGTWVQGGHDPQLQFPNPKRSNSFTLKYQGCCFLLVFRNYTDQNIHDFYRECYNCQTIHCGFSFFFNHIRGIDYFILDLLKRSDTNI